MNRVLEAIATERSELTARLQALEEMERICRDAMGEPQAQMYVATLEVEAPRPKAKAKREPVRALPPAKRSQPQPQRRYITPSESAELAQRIQAIVAEHEPVSFGDIVRHADASAGRVKTALAKLRDAGLVDATGFTSQHRYHLVATLDRQVAEKHGNGGQGNHLLPHRCREDILQTIRSDPNAWTEQRITDAGAWDREQVADACGSLLEDGLVVLDGDGTYRPAVLGLEAAA